jgi:cell division protein FtsL
MDKLHPDLYAVGFTILVAILSTTLGIIGYFLKDIRGSIKEKNFEQDKEIENLKEEVSDLRASLPREYVLRDDFIRAIASIDHKIDQVTKSLTELNKNINWILGRDKNEK